MMRIEHLPRIKACVPEEYSNFTNSFQYVFDQKDAEIALDLVHFVQEEYDRNQMDPQKLAALYLTSWEIALSVGISATNDITKKIVLNEWDKGLRENKIYLPFQVAALRYIWDRSLLTATFWETLYSAKDKKTIQAYAYAIYDQGNKEDVQRLNFAIKEINNKKLSSSLRYAISHMNYRINPPLEDLYGPSSFGPSCPPPLGRKSIDKILNVPLKPNSGEIIKIPFNNIFSYLIYFHHTTPKAYEIFEQALISSVESTYKQAKSSGKDVYQELKNSLDEEDLQITLDFIYAVQKRSKELESKLSPEFKTEMQEALWKIVLLVSKNIKPDLDCQDLINEWDKALIEGNYISSQLQALDVEWNRDFLTETFWKVLKESADQEAIKGAKKTLQNHGTTQEIQKLEQLRE